MHRKTRQRIWALLIAAVIILFGVFMMITLPEVQTVEEVQELEELR
ncbi:hypothetical protein ACFL37_01760 [Candidatus Margulisiibacteriota bacterium]